MFFSFLERFRHVFATFRWCVTRDETDKALSASKNDVGEKFDSQNTAKNWRKLYFSFLTFFEKKSNIQISGLIQSVCSFHFWKGLGMCLQLFDGALYAMKRIRLSLPRKTVMRSIFIAKIHLKTEENLIFHFWLFSKKLNIQISGLIQSVCSLHFWKGLGMFLQLFDGALHAMKRIRLLSASKNGVG